MAVPAFIAFSLAGDGAYIGVSDAATTAPCMATETPAPEKAAVGLGGPKVFLLLTPVPGL